MLLARASTIARSQSLYREALPTAVFVYEEQGSKRTAPTTACAYRPNCPSPLRAAVGAARNVVLEGDGLAFHRVLEEARGGVREIDVGHGGEGVEHLFPDHARRAAPLARLAEIPHGEANAALDGRRPHDRRDFAE